MNRVIKNNSLYTGRKVVIIGAGDFQIPLILKAKEFGFETHVFAWKEGAIGEKEADFFYPIDIRKKEEILQVCRAIGPDAVTSIASDLASITVQYICEHLNLTCNSIHCVNLTTNKFEMRKALKKSGIFVPTFQIIKSSHDLLEVVDWAYPIIVKPVDRSGSRGITKVYNQVDLKVAVETAIHVSFDESAIVEEFIEGSEYSCETISFHGEHYFLAFTKKYTTGEPDFIETGHLQEEFLLKERKEEIIREVFRGLDALEIKEGAAHTEFKITP